MPITKSVKFYDQDAELLDWCLSSPQDFSGFVKRILGEAMEREQAADEAAQPIDFDALADVVGAAVRDEMARLNVASVVSDQPEALEEEITDASLEERICVF